MKIVKPPEMVPTKVAGTGVPVGDGLVWKIPSVNVPEKLPVPLAERVPNEVSNGREAIGTATGLLIGVKLTSTVPVPVALSGPAGGPKLPLLKYPAVVKTMLAADECEAIPITAKQPKKAPNMVFRNPDAMKVISIPFLSFQKPTSH